MNINESVRDWVFHQVSASYPSLAVIDLVTMGETDDLGPPFLAIYESGVEAYAQDGVMLPGVSVYEITCELHTIPVEEAEEGTTPETEREYRRDFYDILGDRTMIDWISNRNGWQVFDIRLPAPTTEASDGRRLSRWTLTITAAPN
tara:strand:- start:329 stop:766 length:438 start_codon:yes stop_codon:yes gene_type:complete